jgi:hypothetical protein
MWMKLDRFVLKPYFLCLFTCSSKRAWCSSIDIDPSANFLYACGGAEGPYSTHNTPSSASSASTTTQTAPIAGAVTLATVGWASVCLLGDVGNTINNRGYKGTKGATALQPITSTHLPVPVQRAVVLGDDLVCAGPQPQIRYLSRTTLGESYIHAYIIAMYTCL